MVDASYRLLLSAVGLWVGGFCVYAAWANDQLPMWQRVPTLCGGLLFCVVVLAYLLRPVLKRSR